MANNLHATGLADRSSGVLQNGIMKSISIVMVGPMWHVSIDRRNFSQPRWNFILDTLKSED